MALAFSARSTDPELMDDPHGDERVLRRTLRRFVLINATLSRSRMLARRHFGQVLAARRGGAVSLLDAGAGGGDFARWFTRHCASHGVRAEVTCMDSDARVRAYARECCAAYDGVRVVDGDICRVDRDSTVYDLVYANHLLHHLPDTSIPGALRALDAVAGEGLLVSDLLRSRVSFVLYALFCAPLLLGTMAAYDGLVSIRRGFLPHELERHVREAGLADTLTVTRVFPGRVVVWRTGPGNGCRRSTPGRTQKRLGGSRYA